MEQHPDREPGRAEAVDSGNDNDGNRNKQFERKRIYDSTSASLNTKKDAKRCHGKASNLRPKNQIMNTETQRKLGRVRFLMSDEL